jgi:hypothetical protein
MNVNAARAGALQILLVGIAFGVCGAAREARADDCPAVTKAFEAQQKRPWRMSFKGQEAMIKVDGAAYMRQGDTWVKMPDNAVAATMAGDTTFTECRSIGPDTVDGMPMVGYEYKAVPKKLEMTPRAARVWIGTADGLPYKWEMEGKVETFNYTDVKAPR